MIDFPIEEIPNLRSFLKRGNKMFQRTLPYKGFAKRFTKEDVEAVKKVLEELPPKDERA